MPIPNFGKNQQKSEIGIKEIANHLAKIRETKSTTGFSDLGYQYSYGDKKQPSVFLYNSLPAVHHATHLLNNLSKKELIPPSGNVWTPSTRFNEQIKESDRLTHPGLITPKESVVGLQSSTKIR